MLLKVSWSCGARSSAILKRSIADSRIAAIDVDPAAAAPCPGRAAVQRKRLADDRIRGIELVEQGQRVAEHGQHGGIAAEDPGLPREFETAQAVRAWIGREMIDDTLDMRPRRQRDRERMAGIKVHRSGEISNARALPSASSAITPGMALSTSSCGAELGARLPQRTIDLGTSQMRLQRRDDPGREMLVGDAFVDQNAVAAMRPELPAGLAVEQAKQQVPLA